MHLVGFYFSNHIRAQTKPDFENIKIKRIVYLTNPDFRLVSPANGENFRLIVRVAAASGLLIRSAAPTHLGQEEDKSSQSHY
jgi:hypothetical protein